MPIINIKLSFLLPLFFFLFFLLPLPSYAQTMDPQYIFVRVTWDGNWPNQSNQYSDAAVDEIINKIGTKGNNDRRLGIGALFNILENGSIDSEDLSTRNKESLQKLLDLSYNHDIPVFIVLDPISWWETRSDLWNWFDPNLSGYNPKNRDNVEWTCWDNSCAISKSWRNWGSEIEIKPHPNLGSHQVVEEIKSRLRIFIPVIADWYQNLPDNKKYLFGGIALGMEVDISGHYYYFPNGVNNGQGLAGSVQLGYAAVKSMGIKSSGTISSSDLNEVVKRYLDELNSLAYNLGIPRSKIFNHTSGFTSLSYPQTANNVSFVTPTVSLSKTAQPGWSLYNQLPSNPSSFLENFLKPIGATQWTSPEWRAPGLTQKSWETALRATLSYHNNRFLNIANWDGEQGIRDKNYAIKAIKQVLNESPSCWVTAPQVNIKITGNSATFSWIKGNNNDAIYLNVTTNGEFTVQGTFQEVNIANALVTDKNSYTVSDLKTGRYYWLLAADGCNGQQRRIVDGFFDFGTTDLNNDGKTNIFDHRILILYFGQTGDPGFTAADINKDGRVDIFDYQILTADF